MRTAIAFEGVANLNGVNLQITDHSSVTISSEVLFREPISVLYRSKCVRLYSLDLLVRFNDVTTPSASFYCAVSDQVDSDNGSLIDFSLDSQMVLDLPECYGNEVVQKIQSGCKFHLYGNLGEDPSAIELGAEEASVNLMVHGFTLSLVVGSSKRLTWATESRTREFEAALNYLSFGPYSQVRSITNQFAKNAAKSGVSSVEFLNSIEEISEILGNIRSSNREWVNEPGMVSSSSNIWWNSPGNFKEAISSLDVEQQDKLQEQYDTLWKYVDLDSVIKFGEDKHGASVHGFQPSQEEIEPIVRRVLVLNNVHSRLLEAILVNVLLYVETIGFARVILAKSSALGVPIASPVSGALSGMDSVSGFAKIFAKGFVKTMFGWIVELLKLALTLAVAFFLSNENQTAMWIIACSYTFFRWWKAHSSSLKADRKDHLALLNDMASIYKLTSVPSYNPGLVREQLYKVTERGAVYSQTLFDILDRQVLREKVL